jgi:hypothetical protein
MLLQRLLEAGGRQSNKRLHSKSDYDYVLNGNHKTRNNLYCSLPGAKNIKEGVPGNIDISREALDVSKPYATFHSQWGFMDKIELLDSSSNAVIAKHSAREFPGILIQGDTMKNLLGDLIELKEEISKQNTEAAFDISESVIEKLTDLLTHYELVLEKHGISLPYFEKVRSD